MVLSINNISKSYGNIRALKGVTFHVPEGSVYGVLGPNGSGKTTLLGILLDVLKADGGTYHWFDNVAPHDARKRIGSLLETPNFYHYLSGYDNLEITAGIRNTDSAGRERVLRQVGLWERRNSKFQTYSLGMKQRLAIGAALLGSPEVLLLDEPTNGLDPAGIAEIRALIKLLSSQGITIIIASHLLDEIEKVCTHVAILKHGDLLLHGHVNEVLLNEDTVEVKAENMPLLLQTLQQMPGITAIKETDSLLMLSCGDVAGTAAINSYCASRGIVLSHLLLRRKSLETRFMELTN